MRLVPGDIVVVQRKMRAWVSDLERGTDGAWVRPGDVGLIVETWSVGNQVRLRLLISDRLVVFSNPPHTVHLNWRQVATDTTPSGSA